MTNDSPTGDALDPRPQVTVPDALGIGIVGSGNIIENAHIPSYQAAGYRIVGIASRQHANAVGVAERRGLGRAFDTIDELIQDPNVDVVDVAVPPDYQPDIVIAALEAGKHVLAQKPLAMSYSEAQRMVAAAESSGRVLAVNQNGRFDPSINATRSLVHSGALGQRLVASLSMCIQMPWQTYYRDPKYQQLMLLHMSVHHIDQLRWIFGDPIAVTALTRSTGDPFYGDTIAQYALHYDDGFWASSLDDGTNWTDDFAITYRIQGTDMCLKGEIGWPHGTYSTLRSQRRGDSSWEEYGFSRQWFPDAFAATMGELLSAVEGDREPITSGRDNLTTMRAVFAAYRSAAEGRTVRLDEVTDDAP